MNSSSQRKTPLTKNRRPFHPYYDFYAYGGIYRKVAVTELPEVYLDYERITPLDLKEGTVEIHLEIAGKWESLNMIELSFDDGQMISVPVPDKIVHTVQKFLRTDCGPLRHRICTVCTSEQDRMKRKSVSECARWVCKTDASL